MDGSSYELELIDDLLNGQLTLKLNSSRLTYLNYFAEKFTHCQVITVLEFKKRNNIFSIISRKDISFIHPLADSYQNDQVKLFSIENNLSSIEEILLQLEIPIDKIVNFSQKSNKSSYQLKLFWNTTWDFFNDNQLKYYYLNSILQDEKAKIRKRITQKIINALDNKLLCNYLQKLKQEINYLSLDILRKFNIDIENSKLETKDHYQEQDFYILIHLLLEFMHDFIEERYNDCLENEFKISSASFKARISNLNQKTSEIKSFFLQTNITKELRTILFSAFDNLVQDENSSKITLNQFNYLDFYICQLLEYISSNDNPKLTNENKIIDLLYELNYNNLKFVSFNTSKIKEQLQKIKSESKQKKLIYLEIKNLNQIHVRTKKEFLEHDKSLKKMIIDWLNGELLFLNKVYPTFENIDFENKRKTSSVDEKIMTDFSISSGMVFSRLMFEVGLLKNKKLNRIHEILADTFQTKSQNEISIKSMKNKHYVNDSKAIEEVRQILNKMQDKLDEL